MLTDLAQELPQGSARRHPARPDPGAPAGLDQLHSAIDGAGWGLLTLSFTGAALGYWLSSYTSSGAQQAATAFARTVGAIGLLISSPYIFYAATEAVNQLTARASSPRQSSRDGMTQLFKAHLRRHAC